MHMGSRTAGGTYQHYHGWQLISAHMTFTRAGLYWHSTQGTLG